MALVNLHSGESIENALRRFKRKVMTEEIIKDLKKHAHFIPPGQKAKLKSAMARKRNKKRNRPRIMNNRDGQQGGGGRPSGPGGGGGNMGGGGGFNR
jgi:small subunit ribosomal protein S21